MSRPVVLRARAAVFVSFLLAGLIVATWLSRIPQVRDNLEFTPGQLGRVLLMLAVGSVLALPTAGLVINRIGARRTVAGGVILGAVGIVLLGVGGGPLASVPVIAVGLFVVGYGSGVWDVAMNVEGAAVERRLGRSIMPQLHAGFSVGTVAGAGLGAGAAAVHLPVLLHLGAVGVVVAVVGLPATRWYLPADPAPVPAGAIGSDGGVRFDGADVAEGAGLETTRVGSHPGRFRIWDAWREPRTLLVGVLVLTFALSEGIAYDWLAVGLVDGLGVSNALGVMGLAVFVSAMTVARTAGSRLIDRFGRVLVLRVSALLAGIGVLLVVFGGWFPIALVGALAWGLGTALGFPVGMSAGADDPDRAAIRVSVVASVAYTAFLAGPPLLGSIGDQVGVHRALLVTVAAVAIGALVASATRPLAPSDPVDAGSRRDTPAI